MNLLRLIRNTFPRAPAPAPNETCASCGKPFACGVTLLGCWCSEIKLSDAQRAELRQRYRGCLCSACLEKSAESNA